MADITMPQLGETVTEGTITKWFKAVGDAVAEDEPLFEVSTDKVDSEVPSPVSGTLTEIKVAEGDTVDVGRRAGRHRRRRRGAGRRAGPDAEAQAAAEAAGAGRARRGARARRAEPAPEPAAGAGAAARGRRRPPPPPAARRRRPPPPRRPPAPRRRRATAAGRLLSPVVRRLVAEHGLDPAAITGTGVGGRITRNDVLAAAEAGAPRRAEPPRPAAAPARRGACRAAGAAARRGPAAAPSPRRAGDRWCAPATATRSSRTPTSASARAEHMRRSLDTSAHVYASIEVDYEGVERVRRAHKDAWRAEEGFGLTYLPFVVPCGRRRASTSSPR